MTSYHGADTQRVMDDMRRQTKRKQSQGTGGVKKVAEKIDFKEVARNVPRHFVAIITPEFAASIRSWCLFDISQGRSGVPTLDNFKYWGAHGLRKAGDSKEMQEYSVKLTGDNARAVGLDDQVVVITPAGFTMADGKMPPVQIHSITFKLSEYDTLGIQAKWNHRINCVELL